MKTTLDGTQLWGVDEIAKSDLYADDGCRVERVGSA